MATKFYTFTGESSMEALKKAQDECGERAILVTTKQIQPKTINKKPLYEILVSVEEDPAVEPKKRQSQKQNLKAYEEFLDAQKPPKKAQKVASGEEFFLSQTPPAAKPVGIQPAKIEPSDAPQNGEDILLKK